MKACQACARAQLLSLPDTLCHTCNSCRRFACGQPCWAVSCDGFSNVDNRPVGGDAMLVSLRRRSNEQVQNLTFESGTVFLVISGNFKRHFSRDFQIASRGREKPILGGSGIFPKGVSTRVTIIQMKIRILCSWLWILISWLKLMVIVA